MDTIFRSFSRGGHEISHLVIRLNEVTTVLQRSSRKTFDPAICNFVYRKIIIKRDIMKKLF